MKQKIDAPNAVLAALSDYAGRLGLAASMTADAQLPERVARSLAPSLARQPAPEIMRRLTAGQGAVLRLHAATLRQLANAEVTEALTLRYGGILGLDRVLEGVIDAQGTCDAALPPPHLFFRPVEDMVRAAFPRAPEDPVETADLLAFEAALDSDENPWAGRA